MRHQNCLPYLYSYRLQHRRSPVPSRALQSQRRITRLLSEVIHTYRHHIYLWGVLHRVQNSTSLVFSLNILFTAVSPACMFSEENLNVVLIFVPLYVSCFFALWLFSGFFVFFFSVIFYSLKMICLGVVLGAPLSCFMFFELPGSVVQCLKLIWGNLSHYYSFVLPSFFFAVPITYIFPLL